MEHKIKEVDRPTPATATVAVAVAVAVAVKRIVVVIRMNIVRLLEINHPSLHLP